MFTVNSNTGELKEVLPRTPAGLNPTSLAMDSGGDLLFVANQTSNTVSVYTVSSSDGSFDRSRRIALPYRFAAGSAGFVSFGKIPVCGQFEFTGGVRLFRHFGDGQFAGGSRIAVYGGQRTEFPGGDPSEHFLYVTNFIDNTVSGLSIDPTSGALTAALDSPFAAGTGPISVTVDPAGKYLYVTNIGSNNVSAYTIDASTGATTALTSPFAAGTRPVSATVDPAGAFLYVCNQSSKNITKFQINQDTGGLPSSVIPRPRTWLRRRWYSRSE